MNKFLVLSGIILIAAMSRLFPHIPNFTPIGAMALFGGVYYQDKRLAFLMPLICMFISDLILGFHSTMIFVYSSFILTTGLGLLIRNYFNLFTLLSGSIISSILFYLITNFGVWTQSDLSLSSVYFLGLPFLTPTLFGDLFYNLILFGSFYFIQEKKLV